MAEAENPRAVMGGNHPPEPPPAAEPATIPERLAQANAAVLAEIERIAGAATGAPKKVRSEGDLHTIGAVVVDAKKMAKRVLTLKTEAKKPYLDGGRAVDGYFNALSERLTAIVERLEARATDYQEEVAAEARLKAEAEAEKLRQAADVERQKAEELAAAGARGAAKALDKAERLEMKADRSDRQAEASAADLTRSRSADGFVAGASTKWKGEITSMDEIDLEKLRPFLKREDVQTALNTFVRIGNRELRGARIFQNTKATFR